ncbi:MAG: aldolase [Bdellovibrionaceae bacterium]|mgnify:CR=1 FL=1|nr:aldolase [Pseudobdellovibrionaceae bacterium]
MELELTSEELLIADEIVAVCKRLYRRNCLAAADGNISFRVSDDRILMTPTGISKAFMHPQEMALLDINGDVLIGKPSGERKMHLAVYRNCPQAKAVVHAHPPTAIAWSVARPDLKELPSQSLSEVILAAGSIPFASYARPGEEAMGTVLEEFLPEHRALILSRHGALTWGESLNEAWMGMERIEHVSQILMSAEKLGGMTMLPAEEITALYELRKKLGPKLL